MQFSDINFIEHGGRHGLSTGLLVAGYWVPKNLFELMWAHATESLPTLDWSKKQSVVTIFGDEDLWVSYRIGDRIALGRCLKYLADHSVLPIHVANSGKKGPRKYVHNK